MFRDLCTTIVCVCILGLMAKPALADTHFSSKGIKVRKTWVVDRTNLALKEAPASRFVDNQEAFAKLWKAWRTDELPKVDFSKEIVLVLTAGENASVQMDAVLDKNGVLTINTLSTERVSHGNTYVLVIVERDGIKKVGKAPLLEIK